MSIEENLSKLGLELPEAPEPLAAYVPAIRAGDLLFVSGQLPLKGDMLVYSGKVPDHVEVKLAQIAARQCLLNALAIVQAELDGDWSKLQQVVRLGVYVQSGEGFADQAVVANGASELLHELLEDRGRHARAAIGVNALPKNAPVELELIAEVS